MTLSPEQLAEAVEFAKFVIDVDDEIGEAMGLPIGDEMKLARALLQVHAELEATRSERDRYREQFNETAKILDDQSAWDRNRGW